MADGPLIVQSDKTLLLEVDHPDAEAARRAIAPFAELERAPEHVHTYRLTPLGLWNARAAGHDAEQVVNALLTYSRYAVPHALLVDVADTMDRYGRLTLEKDEGATHILWSHLKLRGINAGGGSEKALHAQYALGGRVNPGFARGCIMCNHDGPRLHGHANQALAGHTNPADVARCSKGGVSCNAITVGKPH